MKERVVHTKTEKQYISLLVLLEEQGYKWNTGALPTEHLFYWLSYKEETAVCVNHTYKTISFGSLDYTKYGDHMSFDTYMELYKPNLNKRLIAAVRECMR